jgi:hypothetical protein
MKLAHIVLASTSLFVTSVISDGPEAGRAYLDDCNNMVSELYVTGGCMSFNGRAANDLLVLPGYRCRAYR